MKGRLLNIIIPIISSVIVLVVILSLFFGVKPLHEPVKTTLSDETGRGVSGYCISDLAESNYVKYAYYTPDEFNSPLGAYTEMKGEEVDISSQKNVTKRGTYNFVFYNLDPTDENFSEKRNALKPYLKDDNYWHFSLLLPPCFSACCVYVGSVLMDSKGSISDYDYIEYSEKQGYSETHSDGTAPIVIDLSFYTRREALGERYLQRAKIVTVHYESENVKSGFDGVPIVGSTDRVSQIISSDKGILTVITLTSTFILAILVFTCVLKRSLFAVPQVVLVFGVAGFTFFNLLSFSLTGIPALLLAGTHLSVTLTVIGAVLSIIYAIHTKRAIFLIAPPIAVAFGITCLCIPFSMPILPNPLVLLAILITVITAFSAFSFFVKLEKTNVYLTNNLQSEVSRQTKSLQAVIDERDKLLRYLSHDMKKPVTSIQNFLEEIRKNESNEENLKALSIIDGKLNGLQSDFVQLQKFAKLNYSAETSENFSIKELIEDVYSRLSPDCVANGITFKYTSPAIKVYAKRGLLKSVLDNLVFNAIEHSRCKNITLSVTKSSGVCKIRVTDDGVGVQNKRDVFQPYISENAEEDNLGLGLYICRQHVLSMGGDIEYSCTDGKTAFCISLPLA